MSEFNATVMLDLGGEKRPAKMSFGAMMAIEDELGETIMDLSSSGQVPGAVQAESILFHALSAGATHSTPSRDAVRNWIEAAASEHGLAAISTMAVSCLVAGMAGGKAGNAAASPRKGSKASSRGGASRKSD